MKNKEKKIIALLLAVALIIASFAGCGVKLKTATAVFNVADFGAKNDGRADATKAVAKTIEKAAETGGTIVFPKGSYLIKDTVTFPAGVGVKFEKGAKIKTIDESSIRFNCETIDAGLFQIFEGDGEIRGMLKVKTVYPQWFGAVADDGKDDSLAIEKALTTSKSLFIPKGVYNIEKSISFKEIGSASQGFEIYGEGYENTVFQIANGIIALNCYDNGASNSTVFNVIGIGFKGADKSATAIKIKGSGGSWVNVSKCYFEGLVAGVFFDQSGFCHFTDNVAFDNKIVYEISEKSMFIFFENCKNDKSETFVKAVVSPSGGVSNGIQIINCESTNATGADIYITENQAVFIENCKFTGGTGGDSAIYLKNLIDYRITNCEISSVSTSRDGIMLNSCYYAIIEDNNIKDCNIGLNLNKANQTLFKNNSIENSKTADLFLKTSMDDKFIQNKFMSKVAKPIAGSKTIKAMIFAENTFAVAQFDIAANIEKTENFIIKDNVFAS